MSPAKAGMVKERRTSLAAVTSVAQSLQGITIEANYSAFSESVRRRAPKGVQCAVFCGGRRCKYENPEVWDSTHKAIRGIYSHWVTDEILAMARPCTEIIVKRNLIKQFQSGPTRSSSTPDFSLPQYVLLQKMMLHGQESRCLHHIPKIVLMICERLLMLCSCKPVSLILIRNSGFVAIPVLRTFLASESVQPKLKVSFPESQSAGTLHETSKNAMEVVEEVPEEEEVDEKETSTEKKGEEKKISTFLRNSEEEYKYAGEPNQECIDKTVEAFLRDLSSVREEIRKKVLQFRMQLNHEDGSWRKIQRETDFQVLASLLLEWLEHLRSPVLTQDHIVNIIIQKDSAAAFKSFPLSCQYTLEYLLRFVNHLTIAKHDLSEDLVKRIIAAATHQAVNVRGQYLPSGKSFNNLRKGTFSRLLEFINEMMVVTANREASTSEK
ncbi:unnamed protein product [Bemisia tabaci]|uniref:Uncharacterized protein n=1 Tax=Bemisia tabaci TaxID=7038 RepID=A0A9P0AAX8_BEMTA|nr:unnamed protein product [Bemisia tabaci]